MENKTMIKLVVGTEAMFFVSLIMAFVYMAYGGGFEAHEIKSLDIRATGIFTVLLMMSSITFRLAEKSYKNGRTKGLKGWLCMTVFLGAVFLFGQAKEYWRLIHEKISLSSSVFGTSFFTLTGFHGLHLLIGLIILLVILAMAFIGDFNRPSSTVISTVGIYWHFVDVVWIVVFMVVYVIPTFVLLT